MKLTLIEISLEDQKFLSIWLNAKLFISSNDESIFEWAKGFESGLEYAKFNYDKAYLSFLAENSDDFYSVCEVTRAMPLEQYLAKLDGMGLICEEK